MIDQPRAPGRPARGSPLLQAESPAVLIVSGCEGATQRYRCFHHEEQLRLRGVRCRVVQQGDARLMDTALGHGVVVLHRVAHEPAIQVVIEQARAAGGVVLFDIDDLVFEPDLVHHHHGARLLPPEEQPLYHDGVRRYRQTLLACDGAIVPTTYLAQHVQALGRPAWISRNCLDLELLRLSEAAAGAAASFYAREGGEQVIVGYASGTRTHNEDFEVAAGPALRQIMDRHPAVRLRLIGALDLAAEWEPYLDRVERLPATDWRRLPELIAAFDISLAPLELDNPFCRAKSELKWLEASACAVPTVATATEAFADAIHDGTTGLLARSTADWVAALEALVTDPLRRRGMGQAAAEAVRRHRNTLAQAPGYEATLDAARRHLRPERLPPPAGEAGRRPLRVSLLLSEPIRGSGGHASILRMAGGLVAAGHQVNVHVEPGRLLRQATDEDLAAFLAAYFPPTGADSRLGSAFDPSDVAIATLWTTAAIVSQSEVVRAKAYFVQDFEPYFYPVGHDHWSAEASYRLGLRHITLGPWLAEWLRARYGARAEPIDFGVDHAVYHPALKSVGDLGDAGPRIVFYARPSTLRRGTELGLAALGLVKAARPEVEVVLYGSDRGDLADFPHAQAGVLPPEALARLYRSATLGLVLSYTNLSFVPLELMACGTPVVAVDAEPVRWVLRDGQNAILADATPESLAAGMLRLLDDQALCERLAAAGEATVRDLSWERSTGQFVDRVEALAAAAPGGSRSPAAAAGARPAPRPFIDALVPHDGGTTLALGGDLACSWDVVPGADGLWRVDLRLRGGRPHRAQPLRLTVDGAGETGGERLWRWIDARRTVDEAWLAVEVGSLGACSGRRLVFHLEQPHVPANEGVQVVMEAAGQRPVFRTWALDPAPAWGTGADLGLLDDLVTTERALAAAQVGREAFDRERLAGPVRWWRRQTRRLPPVEVRPWSADLSLRQKVRRSLTHTGPVAVGHEVLAVARWHISGRREADA